ncbi:putative nucleotidyltransferase, ribonuclease H [Tanacetum coccineum]
MTEPSGGGLDDRYEREGTPPPLTKEQIEGHISTIKSIIKDYNRQNKADPIRLDFGTDNIPLNEGRVAREKDVGEEDLSKPFKEKLKTPLTRRIIEFAGPEYVMPANITLIKEWYQLREAFTTRYSIRRACYKEPYEITKVVRRANETLPAFKERWTVETGLIMGVPEVMKISSFMDSIKSPELAKRFSSNIPKTVDEMMRRVDEFVRAEEAYALTELPPGESRDIHRRLSFPTGPRDVHQRLTFPTSKRNDRDNRSSQGRDYKGNDYKNPYKVRDNFNGGRHRDYRAPYPQRDQANKAVPVLSLDSLIKCPKEILATETQLQLPAPRPVENPLKTGDPDKYCDYHQDKGHHTNDCIQLRKQLEIALESGKLNHLMKDLRQRVGRGQGRNPPPPPKVINMVRILSSKEKKRKDREATEAWMNTPITFPGVISDDASDEPLIIEAEVEGYLVRRVYVDEGSSVEVMFEHCFENLPAKVRAGLRETKTDLVGFAGEVAKPLGKIDLEVCFGNEGLSRKMSIKFLVVRAPSPYNIILGRPGLKALHAIPSTIHSMIRFPTPKGIATLVTRATIIAECRFREGKQILTEKQPEIHGRTSPLDVGADLTEQILVNPCFPDQIVTIGGRLSPVCKNQLKTLLINNMEVFAWEPSDMTGVPRRIIEHSLNVNPSLEPFCLKRRTFSPEKSKAVTNEVAEWVRAGIVHPVKYPTYISNPVLVKKCDGSWRMCTDFKNLNSACPKDYYPLPSIDCKVEAVMGFKYKCFLDAYKGYHQIQMAREDEEKTAFYTEQGTYCYMKMPFGLKNAGATYQRLVDSTFQSQIGRNLEAYVDDMVIKSKDEKDLLADIAETFESLKVINVKLNPKKCSFGVEEGKFLGYMVTSKGIRANPKKTKAISDLTSPKTLKEMAKVQWKVGFVKSVPGQAEEAFQQMKRLIISLPSLTPPFPKETLYAYLAVANEAVSAVLLTDRNGRQCPVQYVSRTLNDAEKNYSPLEKLALSLVNMTRRLRRYFEAHPVKVITDQPIKNILSRTEASGKLAKYAVEIGTYKISFLPRNAIKGQVLADFLSDAPDGEAEEEYFRMPEVPPEVDDTEVWTLFTDGAASLKGSGAGLVLIGPSGLEYTYALRLTFVSTNNEAEYEALLAGLRIARKMKVSSIEVKVDSKLVANQINGAYEATKESMIKYLAKAKEFISEFKTFSIENIPREDNQKADILSKLATVPFSHLTKEILVEVLNERSTDAKEVQTIMEEEGENWMTPIINYLEEGIVPSDKNEARSLRSKISQYVLESGVLFKKGYLVPMLRCVGPLQANYVIREIHMGSCGMHIGPRAVVRKAMRQGYYWPTMHADAKKEVDKCDSCQIHSPIPRLPKTHMTSIMAPWPFYQWGMDILGPLTPARGGAKFVIVAIDYFTKWIEAKPLVKITGKEVIRFVMDNIICRFGLPRIIVTDNGAQLVNEPFKGWCTRFKIQQMNTSVAHPQANGLVERANRSLMEGIKTRLGRERAGWVDELPNVLWAHRTSIKQSNGETPFSLTYGSEAVIPAEIGIPSYRTLMIREEYNEEEQRLNLDLLQERREAAAIREAKYKTKMEQYYNKRVRPAGFRPGEFVYRRNEASRMENEGKLGPNWEGPYRVTEAFENGSYKLQTMEDKVVPRTWHAVNLRKCYL